MSTFQDQIEFLISVHEIEDIFIQTVKEYQNALLIDPITAMIDPYPQIDYQQQADILASGLNSKSIQILADYCQEILSQNRHSGFGLALRTALQTKASTYAPSATQKHTTNAWSVASSPTKANCLSKEATALKEQVSTLMAWDEDEDFREIRHNLNDFYQANKNSSLSALRELLNNENVRSQFTTFVKKIFDVDCVNLFARWLAEEIGQATYPAINGIKDIPIQNNITKTLIALSFYAIQTKNIRNEALIYDIIRLMYQNYDNEVFTESDDIFISLFKSDFIPAKDELLLPDEKILILYQLLITDANHAIALALAIIEHSIFSGKDQMHIHQLINLMKKVLQETGTEREFGKPNKGTPIQNYREKMIRDLLNTFDKDDRIHIEQAKRILTKNMTVDAVVKPIQQGLLMKFQEKMMEEMKDKKLYKGIFKGQELTFEKPSGVGPKADSCLYEVFDVTKEIFINRLLALCNTDVRLAATPEIRQHYIESYKNKDTTNSNNNSAIDAAVSDYHAVNEKRLQLEEDLSAVPSEESKTHKRSREEYEAHESKEPYTAANRAHINAALMAANTEINQILTKIDSIIDADPEHYKNYLARQQKNSNWFSLYLTVAYARAYGINLCLWTGNHHLTLGEESIPSPSNHDEIKETIHVAINLGEFYLIKPQRSSNNNAFRMSNN